MRSYKQYCGVAKALDLVGQRWALLIIRDLLPGPRRFRDLHMPGLTPNVLSGRLKALAEAGLVESVMLAPPAGRRGWQLTPAGRRLEPVVLALGQFGSHYLGSTDGHTVHPRWMLVSLQRRYRGGTDAGHLQLWVGSAPYVVEVAPDQLSVRDGEHDEPRATVRGPMMPLAGLLVHGVRSAELDIEGDEAWLDQLLDAIAPHSSP